MRFLALASTIPSWLAYKWSIIITIVLNALIQLVTSRRPLLVDGYVFWLSICNNLPYLKIHLSPFLNVIHSPVIMTSDNKWNTNVFDKDIIDLDNSSFVPVNLLNTHLLPHEACTWWIVQTLGLSLFLLMLPASLLFTVQSSTSWLFFKTISKLMTLSLGDIFDNALDSLPLDEDDPSPDIQFWMDGPDYSHY